MSDFLNVMLSVIVLIIIMLSVIMLNVVMLSVGAAQWHDGKALGYL